MIVIARIIINYSVITVPVLIIIHHSRNGEQVWKYIIKEVTKFPSCICKIQGI